MPDNRTVDDNPGRTLPAPEFPAAPLGREGYTRAEVDAFVAALDQALRHDPPTLAPYEVDDQRFRVRRLGNRYALREVDDYLDRAHELLRDRHGEDGVAALAGNGAAPQHFPTWWIYLIALVLIAVLVGFALTQL
jgi:hypothetical protein